jgi:SAM-dependent methyltransferase
MPNTPLKTRYRVKFPAAGAHALGQDEITFQIIEQGGREISIRFHDYDQIYLRPGLYEQLFYDRLKCVSPTKVSELLEASLKTGGENITELRVLDLGAGNGMMGEVLKNRNGVARLVGADIIPEARDAAYRDRPDVYDEYFVADFTDLSASDAEQLVEWNFNCLTSVAALGFGDIPPRAFFNALQLINANGWVAFNIKETFLDRSDQSGFSRFIRELIFSEYLEVYHLERYCHRLSMEGVPLYYFALVARKIADIPGDFLNQIEA